MTDAPVDAKTHPDPLRLFAAEAHGRIFTGQYATKQLPPNPVPNPASLKAALTEPRGSFPVIAEVKPSSPTAGALKRIQVASTSRPTSAEDGGGADAGILADAFMRAGARGVSVLAENRRFGGSPLLVRSAAEAVPEAPVLWKDFIVSDDQLKCARHCGASAVLLIREMFTMNLAEGTLEKMIKTAHELGLEVLLEVYDEVGLTEALGTDADMVGVNARDLRAEGLPVSVDRAARVISSVSAPDRPVLALSGIRSRDDMERVIGAGATGALVGGVLMEAKDAAATLEELIS